MLLPITFQTIMSAIGAGTSTLNQFGHLRRSWNYATGASPTGPKSTRLKSAKPFVYRKRFKKINRKGSPSIGRYQKFLNKKYKTRN